MIRSALLWFCLSMLLAWPAAARRARAPSHQTSDFQRDVDLYPDALLAASEAMSGGNIDSDPHVYTTVLRPANAGDAQRAAEILEILRQAMARYKDYRTAIADGYEPFMPKVGQSLYWFISSHNAYLSTYLFNPGHPTCLLYKKSKGAYELAGALFTAPKSATESQLNDRIPLSVARWHEHVNLCVAPKDTHDDHHNAADFGLHGSITTPGACAAAAGRWVPQVFGWMVAVYPFQANPSAIWPQ